MNGYLDCFPSPVRWRGMTAAYTVEEKSVMRLMPVREQAIVHLLKAFTHGEISESVTGQQERDSPGRTSSEVGSLPDTQEGRQGSPVYTDPEEIPFGKPKKKRPVYALVWTWRRHRVVKTKALATRKMRAWKRWHERNGWKVLSHSDGYFAARGPEREVISLHEYDRDTNERLR